MGKGRSTPQPVKKTGDNSERKNGKAFKKHPKKFDAEKRRLVNA